MQPVYCHFVSHVWLQNTGFVVFVRAEVWLCEHTLTLVLLTDIIRTLSVIGCSMDLTVNSQNPLMKSLGRVSLFLPVYSCVLLCAHVWLLHTAPGWDRSPLQRSLLPCLRVCYIICKVGVIDSEGLQGRSCDGGKAGMKGFFFSWLTFSGSSHSRRSYPMLKEWGVGLHLCSPNKQLFNTHYWSGCCLFVFYSSTNISRLF